MLEGRHQSSERRRREQFPRGHQALRTLALVLLTLAAGGCFDVIGLRPELRAAVVRQDALGVADRLEQLIDEQRATARDRQGAYDAVRQLTGRTAAYAYARASLAGRLAQIKGLNAVGLIREMERWARTSIQLDAKFRNEAAKRMLATLYVLAPASMLEHGDSEEGLEMLEELAQQHPNDIQNHLRLAEGYISLSDPEPSFPALCRCLKERDKLRASEIRLLDQLVEQVGGKAALDCQ